MSQPVMIDSNEELAEARLGCLPVRPGALMQIMSFAGGLCCGYVADRRGSDRVALAVWWRLGAATMLVLSHADSHLANVAGITAAGFLVIGLRFVLNFTARSYDTKLRASAIGTELGIRPRRGARAAPVAGILTGFAVPPPLHGRGWTSCCGRRYP